MLGRSCRKCECFSIQILWSVHSVFKSSLLHSVTFDYWLRWAVTVCIVHWFVKPPPENWRLYAMEIDCAVWLFVCLSAGTRTTAGGGGLSRRPFRPRWLVEIWLVLATRMTDVWWSCCNNSPNISCWAELLYSFILLMKIDVLLRSNQVYLLNFCVSSDGGWLAVVLDHLGICCSRHCWGWISVIVCSSSWNSFRWARNQTSWTDGTWTSKVGGCYKFNYSVTDGLHCWVLISLQRSYSTEGCIDRQWCACVCVCRAVILLLQSHDFCFPSPSCRLGTGVLWILFPGDVIRGLVDFLGVTASSYCWSSDKLDIEVVLMENSVFILQHLFVMTVLSYIR